MTDTEYRVDTEAFAKCIAGSKRIRWDIDSNVFRGREFDFSKKFLPDGISKVERLDFLDDDQKRMLSQIQGRTYAAMFGFVERFITAKMLEITRDHWLGDQIALEAIVRFCDEELKHQELFRRMEIMIAAGMPEGYRFLHEPNQVAAAVLQKPTWSVMALIYEIELFTQEHYKQSIEPDDNLSELYRDVFLFHWKEEAHHAVMDALEWPRLDKKLTNDERDRAVDELIVLVGEVDGILQAQSGADVQYFLKIYDHAFAPEQVELLKRELLQAYRWQYIFSGTDHPRFKGLFSELTSNAQQERTKAALAQLT